MKTKLNKSDSMAISGLLVLAKRHMNSLQAIEESIAELLDIPLRDTNHYQWITEYVYGNRQGSVQALLEHLNLKEK